MVRFLHVADVHLGFDRYDNKRRSQDFFYAFYDALETYAVGESVDFVVIAGDLFEHRMIQPAILNQAQRCLKLLEDAAIPAIAIEGNHDNRPYGTKTNWLRYLAELGQLVLLEPGDTAAGESLYEAWSPSSKRGSYIDLDCGVRVLGSAWYGATAPVAIQKIAEAIADLPPCTEPQILLFHHGLEGQIARYAGALRYADLLPLKEAGIDYLALGHIHKSYSIDNWVFNPGSIEANSIEESTYERGVYLATITNDGVHADLKRDYYQRPIVRLSVEVSGTEGLDQIEQQAIATVDQAMKSGRIPSEPAPVVELRIRGQLGFDRLDLDVRALQQQLQEQSGALLFLLKNEADSVVYQSPVSDDASRLQIEQEVYRDLAEAHHHYRKHASAIATGLMGLKDLQLEGRPENELHDFVDELLNQPTDSEDTPVDSKDTPVDSKDTSSENRNEEADAPAAS
jgi:DNA repair exonuclease SbcCD nuclease subunit